MKNHFYFDNEHHEFALTKNSDISEIYHSINLPVSIIVQVTRRCPLTCSFCSESEPFDDPSFTSLDELKYKIKGVKRVYLSGGEPLIREDIFDIIKSYRREFDILGLPTNCINITKEVCEKLKENINYINAGLDGPRRINNEIRGGFNRIIEGLTNLRNSGIEVSLSTVILKLTLPYLEYVVQIADTLDITKVKFVVPVFRGRAKSLKKEDFANNEDIVNKFSELKNLKTELGWKPRIKYTLWNKDTEGYAILIYPNQNVYCWPVLNAEESVLKIGDLNKDSLHDIWNNYPFKKNHINKYIGITMNKA